MAVDYFEQEVQSKAPAKDFFAEEIDSNPNAADANLNKKADMQFAMDHPYLKTLKDTGDQLVNPLVQSVNSLSPAVKGIVKGIGVPDEKNTVAPIQGPDMSNAPFAAKALGDLAGGFTRGAADTVAGGGNFIAGHSGLTGLSAYGEGKPIVPAIMNEIPSMAGQLIAGKTGSTLANAAAKPFIKEGGKIASRIGTSLGMGAAAATMAPEGEKLRAAATGATFGALSPVNPIGTPKTVTPEQHSQILDEGAGIYRHILNPGKGIITKVEIKSKGDIDESMKLAARMGLPLQGQEGKLDNRPAIDIVKAAPDPLYEEQNHILESNQAKQFNLDDLATQTKKALTGSAKNAKELQEAHNKVDNEIDAEVLRHGQMVDAKTLNMIKQGMWSKSYDPLQPNANDTARAIGTAAKNTIEGAFPDETIKENNAQIGKYLQLQKILEATHGQIIQGGKLGKYFGRLTGLGVGGAVGHSLPVPGGEAMGAIIGQEVGAKVNSIFNDPARITANWANKLKSFKVDDPNPVVLKGKRPSSNPKYGSWDKDGNFIVEAGGKAAMDASQPLGLPAPKPQYLKDRENIPDASFATKNVAEPYARGVPTPDESIPMAGPQTDVSPLKNPQEGGDTSNPGKTSIGNNKGEINSGTPKEEKLRQLNEELKSWEGFQKTNARDPQDVRRATKNIDRIKSAIKDVTKSPIGLGVGLAMAGTLALGANNANAAKDQDRLSLPANQYTMKEEGFSGMPYVDTKGIKTVGYGFSFDGPAGPLIPLAVKNGRRAMTKQEATSIFNTIYPQAAARAQKFAGDSWGLLTENQQKALTDMAYNLKPGSLEGFQKLHAAIQGGHFNTASREILDSNYAKKDVPNRAKRNALLMQGSTK